MASFYKTLGSRLASARRARGLTQAQLGRGIGVGAAHIARIESGTRKPTIELLAQIMTKLELSWEEVTGSISPRAAQTRDANVQRLAELMPTLSQGDARLLVQLTERLASIGRDSRRR